MESPDDDLIAGNEIVSQCPEGMFPERLKCSLKLETSPSNAAVASPATRFCFFLALSVR
jgi:hypothetical protein